MLCRCQKSRSRHTINKRGDYERFWTAEAKRMADNFQGKSEGDLMRAIYTRAVEGKKNGTLTNEQIDMFYRQFAPMVNGVQRKKLQKVVEQLKKM